MVLDKILSKGRFEAGQNKGNQWCIAVTGSSHELVPVWQTSGPFRAGKISDLDLGFKAFGSNIKNQGIQSWNKIRPRTENWK